MPDARRHRHDDPNWMPLPKPAEINTRLLAAMRSPVKRSSSPGNKPAVSLATVIALAGNLFTGTGYFLFSGVFNFGDWTAAAVASLLFIFVPGRGLTWSR